MRSSRIDFFLLIGALLLTLLVGESAVASDICEKALARAEAHSQAAPRRWQKIDEFLRKHVEGEKNPFEGTETDANATGQVHKDLARHLPFYHEVYQLNSKDNVELRSFLRLKKQFDQYISKAVKQSPGREATFAMIEINRMLAQLEAKVQFAPRADKKPSEEKKEDDKEKEKNEKKEKKEKQPAKFPKNDEDQYKPENKDVSSGDGDPSENVHIVETTVRPPLRLLRSRAYDFVDLNRWAPLATERPIDNESEQTKEYIRIRPLGEKQLRIFYNYEGYAPRVGQYKGYSVVEVLPGEYQLNIQTNDEEILLPLARRSNAVFRSGTNAQVYGKKLGIPLQQWPKEFQDFVTAHKGQSALVVAQRLTEYMASKEGPFLYYSIGDKVNKAEFAKLTAQFEDLKRKMPEPLAMAHLKSFNCDGAAWIATLILREYFGAPVRPAAGVTVAGTKVVKGTTVYVTRSNDPLHAWIEVFEKGRWIPFDPTPKANNPQNDSDSDDDSEPLKPIDENDEQNQSQQGAQSESQDKTSEAKEQNAESKDAKDKDGKDKETKKDEAKKEDGAEDEDSDELTEKGLAEKLSEESGGKQSNAGASKIFLKLFEQSLYEGFFEEGNRDKWVRKIDDLKKGFRQKTVRDRLDGIRIRFVENARSTRATCDDSLIVCLRNAQFLISKSQPREAYNILRGLSAQLDILAQLRMPAAPEARLSQELKKVLNQFRRFNHKNAGLYDLTEKFVRSMPGAISQNLLINRYGIKSMSPDSLEVAALAEDLLAGKLRSFQRLAAAKDFVNFALRGMFLPQAKEVLLYQRSLDPRARQSLVIARSPLEIARMLLQPRPGEHLLAPLVQGRQFAVGPRASTLTPDPKTPIERKLSVVLYDISGSMGSDGKDIYMAALLAAFTEMSALEEDVLGRPSHQVVLVPFDTDVHAPTSIKTPEEAAQLVQSLIGNKTKAEGGTDIQKAILEFYRLVGEAIHDRAKNSPFQQFQHANLILFSDGGSTVDLSALEEARKRIDPKLNINMSFVAVGETNEDLAGLAKASNISTTKPNYIEMMSDIMGHLEKSYSSVTIDKEAFATAERPFEVQKAVSPLLSELQQLSVSSKRPITGVQLSELLVQLKSGDHMPEILKNKKEGAVRAALETMEAILEMDLTREDRALLVYDLITSHVRDQGRPLSRLTHTEEDVFRRALNSVIK